MENQALKLAFLLNEDCGCGYYAKTVVKVCREFMTYSLGDFFETGGVNYKDAYTRLTDLLFKGFNAQTAKRNKEKREKFIEWLKSYGL